ncbi:MAG TPA: phosphonate C-P lyase system protein PhnG [Methylomirabilota bacterium]|jgi:alpha-D-ribose 1-methylphosphonate 5-triphosphate synthase subunit PhnG
MSLTDARRRWMAVLAQASPEELERRWQEVPVQPPYRMLRPPETGLVMVRGRAGGTGMRFNVGEMTVTRCALELEGGAVGVAYVRGRDRRHAEVAAMLDALLQDPARRDDLERTVVTPLAAAQTARRRAAAERVAPSRVEFFTMVRGDD